jgi:hypothetical protein
VFSMTVAARGGLRFVRFDPLGKPLGSVREPSSWSQCRLLGRALTALSAATDPSTWDQRRLTNSRTYCRAVVLLAANRSARPRKRQRRVSYQPRPKRPGFPRPIKSKAL